MSVAFTIAKRDLKGMLASPRAAIVFFFFIMFAGMFFNSLIGAYFQYKNQASMGMGQAPNLDQLMQALFYNLHFTLLLIIPAVTMSSFAEEKKQQSIRMLTTSPISASSIVLGKFFATGLLMLLVLLAASVYPMFTIAYGSPDMGRLLSGFLGLVLLIATQLAFGIWVSSMTNNQFVAFLFTMFGLFTLMLLSFIASGISGGNEMITGAIKYLAVMTHLENFFKGMISVSSVFYFLILTFGFLFFTNVVIDSQRWR